MNFKELILPLSLALLTTWGIHYFFFRGSSSEGDAVRSGQSFIAPKTKQELKPLNKEVDFVDAARTKPAQLTEVETNGAKLVFSTDGASLDSIEFKKINIAGGGSLKTIQPLPETAREERCFLVGLPEKTPYYYELLNRQDLTDKVELTYQAAVPQGQLQKKFTVYKNTYKIDLEIKFEGAKPEVTLEPRVFFPSPHVAPIADADQISAIVSNAKGSLEKIVRDSVALDQGWYSPSLFGSDDRYFVHAMVDDQSKFVQRAYYKFTDKSRLVSILEGPAAAVKAGECCNQWRISFYMGPKESEAFAAVDPRLEQTLDYAGFLSPISKGLLYLLKLFYSFLKNYGLAIILLTILVKLILLPFTFRAEEGMQKRAEFDKKLKYIQQKYKDNPEQLARERAELVQKYGMPGLGSCLPLLLQLPIFIALSRVLSSSIELYNAPFVGWIHDLSARDPYYILPLITALSMIAQSLAMAGSDPKQRISTVVMALVIGAVTANLAAGLTLYICTFTILGVLQTKLLAWFKAR